MFGHIYMCLTFFTTVTTILLYHLGAEAWNNPQPTVCHTARYEEGDFTLNCTRIITNTLAESPTTCARSCMKNTICLNQCIGFRMDKTIGTCVLCLLCPMNGATTSHEMSGHLYKFKYHSCQGRSGNMSHGVIKTCHMTLFLPENPPVLQIC